mmetsp:Transcript_19515/g.41164  ORF Transcript_19515/g.41164 Transcript_19515/m.41164 type:complete len:85 (-) Transcript_19515:860-1114(-)
MCYILYRTTIYSNWEGELNIISLQTKKSETIIHSKQLKWETLDSIFLIHINRCQRPRFSSVTLNIDFISSTTKSIEFYTGYCIL